MQNLKLFHELKGHLRKIRATENEYIFLKIKQQALFKTLARIPNHHKGEPIDHLEKKSYTNFRAKQIVSLVDTHKKKLSKKIDKFLCSCEQLQYNDKLLKEQYEKLVVNFIEEASEGIYTKSF